MAKKADTLAPAEDKEKKAIAPSGPNTPAEKKPKEGEPTPPSPPQSQTPEEKKIAELGGEVDRLTNLLTRQEAVTKTAQRDKEIAEKKKRELQVTIEGIKSGEIDISEINLPAEVSPSEEESFKKDVQIGVQNLILGNTDYQNLLSEDVTLREVIKKSPLVLIGDSFSVEDAVEQIKDKLDERVSSLKKNQPEKKPKEGEGPEFKAGPIQPEEGPPAPPPAPAPQTPDEKLEKTIKDRIVMT